MARTLKDDGPHPVDVHVGKRLKIRRKLSNMSQTALGDKVGLTFQQIQNHRYLYIDAR